MDKNEILKRAKYNGIKAAEAARNKDYQTLKSYSDDNINLTQYYPGLSVEIRESYQQAYNEKLNINKRS
jgi:hypothetical protein